MLVILEVAADHFSGELCYQQDNATVHTACELVDCSETHVSQMHYFMLLVTLPIQPGLLTSLCPTTFWGHLKAKCMQPNLMLRELNEHIRAKITAIDKCWVNSYG
jgi:hypothetical protein